jgi:CheY-like chemotaxis protein
MDNNLKILLVDDEKHVRMILSAYFSVYNVDILEAGNGEEALEIMQKNNVDLVILDYYMPKLGGGAVIKRMLDDERLSKIPLILYTVGKFPEEKDRWLKTSTHAFLNKANVGEDLIPTVKEILGKRLQQIKED